MATVKRKRTGKQARFGKWCRRAEEMGAESAKIIRPASVVTAAWVRLKCQYGCGGYGGCLTCPPHSPTPEQTQAALDCYSTALLVHGTGDTSITELVSALERDEWFAEHSAAPLEAAPAARVEASEETWPDVPEQSDKPALVEAMTQ